MALFGEYHSQMKRLFIFSIYAVFFAFTICVNAQVVSLNNAEVVRLQKLVKEDKSAGQQFAKLLKKADSALADAPNPIETITTEGRLKGDPLKTATTEALRDMPKIYALAFAYRIKTDERYLKKAEEFLTQWAAKNKPSGDPIDETTLDNAFEAYDLIKDKLALPNKNVVENWFRAVAKAEIDFPRMKKGRITAINNWNSHRLKIVGEIAWVLSDETLKAYTLENLKTQLAANLNPDGTSFDFLERDALHYHAYDLEPLTKLAIILKRGTGTDFYNYETEKGASIAKSVRFFAPYVSGEKTHEEFVNTKVQFDRDRAKNGEKGYASGTIFNASEGTEAISQAAWFEPKLTEIVRKFDNQKFPNWQTVLNAVTK